MNIKLKLLSIWTPKFILIRELEKTTTVTNEYLDRLIMDCSGSPPDEKVYKGNLEDRRACMAEGHNLRVKILIDILGREMAYTLGKVEMFNAGLLLGQTTKEIFGIGNDVEDTINASKILYRILGINCFTEIQRDKIILWVKSCDLAQYYTPETCLIMSHADKGVLKGLNKNMELEFVERITSGSEYCKACVNIE